MPVRVLIVDDSNFFRRRLTEIISSDEHLQVVGTAVDGVDALEKAEKLNPDVITMDIEMPRMDGITAVRKIMEKHPVPVLMLSQLTTAGAQATFDALDAGALDYLPKRLEDLSGDKEYAKRLLCARLRVLGGRRLKRDTTGPGAAGKQPAVPEIKNREAVKPHVFAEKNIRLILIGASTGGPAAVQQILSVLPENYPIPILIVQHMPSAFTGPFASRLDKLCKINVKEACDGDRIVPGMALIAPGGKQMLVGLAGGMPCVNIVEGTAQQNYKPCVDITFSSAEKDFSGRVLCVVLTGMGADGREGVRQLKKTGAMVWAQDEASCVVYGMPMAVVQAGLADMIFPLPEFGPGLVRGA